MAGEGLDPGLLAEYDRLSAARWEAAHNRLAAAQDAARANGATDHEIYAPEVDAQRFPDLAKAQVDVTSAVAEATDGARCTDNDELRRLLAGRKEAYAAARGQQAIDDVVEFVRPDPTPPAPPAWQP